MKSFVCRVRKHVGNRAADNQPMMPSTIVQKIVMCTCIIDFAITPAINPTTMYQIK